MCLSLSLSGDFLKEPRVYEDPLDLKTLKSFMESQLEDYNLTPGVVIVSIVQMNTAYHTKLSNTNGTVSMTANSTAQPYKIQSTHPVTTHPCCLLLLWLLLSMEMNSFILVSYQ